MIIRPVKPEDVRAITKLNYDELHYDYTVEHTAQMLEEVLARPWLKINVAEVDGQFAGYIQLAEYISLINEKLVNVMELAVVHEFQGQGVGSQLVKTAEEWSHELGFAGVRLNSGAERTSAHEFYEHNGFTKVKYQAKFEKKF
ncbi:hypothetical protein FC62_GL001550 [Amylolactobacillus amylotrophicus DSM 20534]|uniref:Uncharacterized protein n=3 Tax=Amylolactobacillus TaxID=2767876 RepID=A0A0R1YGH4_9LACO|nr:MULTISPECIES: GNAT family N-acetyltransferase [Amylolactobacillus]APT18720.1 hypothetical protein LA20533_05350 [Amylolactobacillus amylophilus DSM 20533 = JCM 1125]KRK37046.1 hypothetical protein FC62_GL001550 [Amylolactobacillus amylotrophicus DSM 20534]KRM41495.1 hypothetical protein FD40_GL001333 [Amylolactobacillus amylophilus DSM 20533 = JCM 1125]GED80631.1 N-acetyltransferase [Amylolactobacillus amylophilus]